MNGLDKAIEAALWQENGEVVGTQRPRKEGAKSVNFKNLMVMAAIGLSCVGCSTGSGTAGGSDLQGAGSSQNSALTNFLPGNLRLRLDNATLRYLEQVQVKLSDSVVSYQIEVLNETGDFAVIPALTVAREFATQIQEIYLANVPKGTHQLLVTGLDSSGASVGSFAQKVEIGDSLVDVLIGTLAIFGQTREVGRLSVNSDGKQFLRRSADIDISDEGRLVAFVTSEKIGDDTNPHRDVYIRDRTTGTLQRQSFLPDSTGATFADIGADCNSPRLSKDSLVFDAGGRVYLRDRARGITRQIGLSDAVLPSGAYIITSLGNPSISSDGSLVACQGRATLASDLNVKKSLTIIQTIANGQVTSSRVVLDSLEGVIPKKGSLLFYKQSGSEAIHRLDLQSNQDDVVYTPRLTFGLPVFACDGTGDSLVVQEDGRLFTSNKLGTVKPVSNVIVGAADRPAISGDGRRVVFWTSDSLVRNDLNQFHDVYVADTNGSNLSRVSVAGDGTSCRGGLSFDSGNLAVSADGTRVAFVSPDSQLVPGDTNLEEDVFSANLPTSGRLYTVSKSGDILRISNAVEADGPVTPTVIAAQLQNVRRLFIDAVTNRLYVLQVLTDGSSQLLVFNNASGMSTTATPARRIILSGSANALDMSVDVDRDTLYILSAAGLDRFTSLSTMSGSPTAAARLTGVTGNSLLLDTRRNELYLSSSNGAGVGVLGSVSGLTGSTPILRQSLLVAGRLDFDIAPRGAGGTINSANLLAILNNPTTSNFFLITGNGSDPAVNFAQKVETRLSVSSNSGAGFGQHLQDRTTGEIYVVANDANRVDVRPGGTGSATPLLRTIEFAAPLQTVLALDRSR
ncbi:hypothetical protein IV102_14765 [bacterium]|nr:hypothetical protein [bacterium]